MYAVIETGGKQYRVAPGDVIKVETLPGEAGAEMEFDKVLAVVQRFERARAGRVARPGPRPGHHPGPGRGDKIIVFKFKRKKQYKRTIGHRQNFTAVRVSEIVA